MISSNLRQTVDAVNLHQLIQLIYKVDKTGLKVTSNSNNQNLFAVKRSKRLTVLLHGENGKTITMLVFMSASPV
jgi:hypothetical protein